MLHDRVITYVIVIGVKMFGYDHTCITQIKVELPPTTNNLIYFKIQDLFFAILYEKGVVCVIDM